jgi:hypothetical protein
MNTVPAGACEMTAQDMTGMILRVLLVKDWEDDVRLLECELIRGGATRSSHAWTVPMS